MKKSLLIAVAGLVIVFGIWLYRVLFPGDETKIRRLLAEVAETASLKPNENPLVRLAAAGKLAGLCTSDVVINIDAAELNARTIQGRDELQQIVAAARTSLQSVEVRFPEANVTVEPGGQSAMVNLVAIADVNGEKNTVVQELKMHLVKIDGDWLISRVETVKTLGR